MTPDKPLQGLKVARVSTIAFSTLTQLCPQLEAIHAAGGDITVISTPDSLSQQLKQLPYCRYEPLYIAREINFFTDIASLYRLWKLFRRHQFDVVHSITPKAGLLCAIASRLAGVPIRLHTYTGQPWVTITGVKKRIVRLCDKIIARLNTQCYADSFTQRQFLISQHIIAPSKIQVLGHGSLAGIDLQRFQTSQFSPQDQLALRDELGIHAATKIILFVGRITEDKGIDELFHAFHHLLQEVKHIALVVVGPFEKNLELTFRAQAARLGGGHIVFTGYHSQPERYMAIADILCIPSYREGFGTVVIEAAAMGVPAVGTRIYGLTDAIVDGETGYLVEPKHVSQLAHALQTLLVDDNLRKKFAESARQRAISQFDSIVCGKLLVADYIRILSEQGCVSQLNQNKAICPSPFALGKTHLRPRQRLVITGATGFIGQHLIKHLLTLDEFSICCVERKNSPVVFSGVQTIQVGDLTDAIDWSQWLQSNDIIIHLAARVHVMHEEEPNPMDVYRQVNVTATMHLARHAARVGAKRFIFLSTIKVHGESTQNGRCFSADDKPNPSEAYALSKLEAEQGLLTLAAQSSMDVVIIRPTMVYGPGVKGNFERMLTWLEKGYPFPLGLIHNKRSFVSIYNLVDLLVRCIESPAAKNQIFLVSDGEDVSISELLRHTAKAMGRSSYLLPVPMSLLQVATRLLGQHMVFQRLCGSLQVDIQKTRDFLDWEPVMSMDEALKRTVKS